MAGTSATPATSAGTRIHTCGSPSLAQIQASAKYRGGEISSGPVTPPSMSPKPALVAIS